MTNNFKEYHKWRIRAAALLPEISVRVFALRRKEYLWPSNYELEKRLGYCIREISDPSPEIDSMILTPILFSELVNKVIKEEKLQRRNTIQQGIKNLLG